MNKRNLSGVKSDGNLCVVYIAISISVDGVIFVVQPTKNHSFAQPTNFNPKKIFAQVNVHITLALYPREGVGTKGGHINFQRNHKCERRWPVHLSVSIKNDVAIETVQLKKEKKKSRRL